MSFCFICLVEIYCIMFSCAVVIDERNTGLTDIALANLSLNVHYLELQDNLLTSLPANCLTPYSLLEYAGFFNNRISYIDKDAFTGTVILILRGF